MATFTSTHTKGGTRNMKLHRALATAAVAATVIVGGLAIAPPAEALGPPTATVKSITLVDHGRKIEIIADYRCSGQHNDMTHLWVSVKQGGPDPTAEGSGETVDSWYDNHPVDAIKCDSKHHLQKFYALWHTDKKK